MRSSVPLLLLANVLIVKLHARVYEQAECYMEKENLHFKKYGGMEALGKNLDQKGHEFFHHLKTEVDEDLAGCLKNVSEIQW